MIYEMRLGQQTIVDFQKADAVRYGFEIGEIDERIIGRDLLNCNIASLTQNSPPEFPFAMKYFPI